jgi:hypothetical protein
LDRNISMEEKEVVLEYSMGSTLLKNNFSKKQKQ